MGFCGRGVDVKRKQDSNGKEAEGRPRTEAGGRPRRVSIQVFDVASVNEAFESKQKRTHQRNSYRNLLLLSISFFFCFTSYAGLESLQSSINVEGGLGQVAVSVVYAVFIICSLTVGPTYVQYFGPKVTILSGMGSYMFFTAANFYPTWWTMIPAAVIIGFGASILWIAHGVYLSTLAINYSNVMNYDNETTLRKFNGIFFAIYAFTMIIGNLVASILLNTISSEANNDLVINVTAATSPVSFPPTEATKDNVCGAKHCPYLLSHTRTISQPPRYLVYILISVFLLANILAVITALFLDNIMGRMETDTTITTTKMSMFIRLRKTFKLMTDLRLLLFIFPLLMTRMVQTMSTSSFTLSFVSCSLGVGMVGYVMMVRAATYTAASYICGHLGKYVHRSVNFYLAMALYVVVFVVWLNWQPRVDQQWLFFLTAALEGLGSGIWRVQVGALLGCLFPNKQDIAFAHYNVWLGMGSCVTFLTGGYLCFSVKAYITLAVISLAVLSYTFLEIKVFRDNSQRQRYESSGSNTPMLQDRRQYGTKN